MTASSVSPFNFDRVFDGANGVDDEANGAAKRRFSEDDLEAARLEGVAQGRDEGLTEARAGLEHATAEALAAIETRIAGLDAQFAASLEEIRGEAAQLAFEIAAKLAPTLLRREPLSEVMELIADCLAGMPTEPRIVIRVAENLIDSLQERIDAVATRSGFSGILVLLGEPALQGADCRVEWADGGAERDIRVLQATIEESVASYGRMRTDAADKLRETNSEVPTTPEERPTPADLATDEPAAPRQPATLEDLTTPESGQPEDTVHLDQEVLVPEQQE
jgi:flagellar assembly protein FliH